MLTASQPVKQRSVPMGTPSNHTFVASSAKLHSGRGAAPKLAVSTNRLLAQVIQFNAAIAGELHPTQLAIVSDLLSEGKGSVPAPLLERLRSEPRGARHLTRWINARTDWFAASVELFEEPKTQMMLLGSDDLTRALQLSTAVALSPAIGSVVTQQERRQVASELPQVVLQYARMRSQLTFASHLEALGLEWNKSGFAQQSYASGRSWTIRYAATCQRMLRAIWAQASPQLIDRAQLKLPADWFNNKLNCMDVGLQPSAEEQQACWSIVHRVLVMELAKEWNACFS